MVTKEQAMTCNMFHYGTCTRTLGPHGKATEHVEQWRRNGATQTWVTRPEEFRVPIKFGLRQYSQLTDCNAAHFHTADDCPLRDLRYATVDLRTEEYKRRIGLLDIRGGAAMRGQHDYDSGCQCYRCKGIRNSPARKAALMRKGIRRSIKESHASREEQHARYIDCGPQNWDDK